MYSLPFTGRHTRRMLTRRIWRIRRRFMMIVSIAKFIFHWRIVTMTFRVFIIFLLCAHGSEKRGKSYKRRGGNKKKKKKKNVKRDASARCAGNEWDTTLRRRLMPTYTLRKLVHGDNILPDVESHGPHSAANRTPLFLHRAVVEPMLPATSPLARRHRGC